MDFDEFDFVSEQEDEALVKTMFASLGPDEEIGEDEVREVLNFARITRHNAMMVELAIRGRITIRYMDDDICFMATKEQTAALPSEVAASRRERRRLARQGK